MAVSSPALADDPAILVCEALLKAELKAPKSYERVAASVNGTAVDVSYDAVNAYNAPLRHAERCNFEQKGEVFSITPESIALMMQIEARLAQIRAAGRPNDEHRAKELQQEVADLDRQANAAVVRDMRRELVAQSTGMYPIPATATKLGK